ncbi:hypothetical protein ABW636_17525 [Aquimarina sp. 2201CG1-2-11]|uniref:hypothetical protein n=1 Tax=Aquimarina discodermiae TaxID=3231043 RepID=UPI003462CDF9
MKKIKLIITILLGLITSLCIWMYIQRANLEYNVNGSFLSPDGVVYNEQAKETYGILASIGVFLTGILMHKQIKKNK